MSTSFYIQTEAYQVEAGTPYVIYEVLSKSPSFYTMASCFDQVKINSIWCRIAPDSIEPADIVRDGYSTLMAVAWDRNGVNKE